MDTGGDPPSRGSVRSFEGKAGSSGNPNSGRMIETTDAPWLVVYAKPNCEAKASRWVSTRGWVSYLPYLSEVKISRGGEREVRIPLFPRYLFVQENADLDPVDVAYLPGVADMVRRGDRTFARVEHAVILALQSTERDGVLHAEPSDPPPLVEGELVNVNVTYGGIGYRIVATFSRMDGTERAVVLHEMFNSKRESIVSLNKIERVIAELGSSSNAA